MSVDEYWFGDPAMIYAFQDKFELQQKYDIQMAWSQGAYFKSALASTLVWATLPMKNSDLKQMPKYAENPYDRLEVKQEMTDEKKHLLELARQKLSNLGLLNKKE